MKIVLYLLVILLSSVPIKKGISQTPYHGIDSIKRLLKTTADAQQKIELYGEISVCYFATRDKLDIGKLYVDSMQLLASKVNNERWVMRAQFYYGALERFKGDHGLALEHLDSYVKYFTQAGDSNWVCDGLYQMGVVYSHLGDFPKSLAMFYRILEIDLAAKNYSAIPSTLNNIGVNLLEIDKYEEAIKVFQEALEVYDSLGRETGVAMVYCNIGNVYTEMKEFGKAKDYYQKALQIDRDHNLTYGVAYDLANIGVMFDGLKQYDSALIYHLKALNIRENLPGKDDLANSLVATGRGYKFVGNGRLAEEYLFKGLDLSKEINSKPMIFKAYENLSELYAEAGDFRKAYQYSKLSQVINDSILNEENTNQLNNLQIRYETEKKDQKIELLAKEKEVQEKEAERQSTLKWASLAGLALVALLALVIGYVYNQKLRNQKILALKDTEIHEAHFKRQMSELELKALRAQINPHFLFNCMNSINRMILEGENENASQYLAKFSKLVRLILENGENPEVTLQNELSLLESYIQLESLRFKGKIRYKITVDPVIDVNAMYLPSMVLQPFVENAIWHGLMHKRNTGEGIVEIAVTEKDGRLCCAIEDNGVGREKARELAEKSVLKTKSMGMKITEERLRLLSKQGWEKLINIVDLKDSFNNALGTRVEIVFPLTLMKV